jgi:hypothetical protein
VNGTQVRTWQEFRSVIVRPRMGDTVRIEIERPSGRSMVPVVMSGFTQSVVRIEPIANAPASAIRLRDGWAAGK